MNLSRFLEDFGSRGGDLELDSSGQLHYRIPDTPEGRSMLTRLRERKPEVEEFFRPFPDCRGPYALSRGQAALWTLVQLHPLEPSYNLACAMRIRPDVDLARLRQAAELVAQKHEALRARVIYRQGLLAQYVDRKARLDWEVCRVDGSITTWLGQHTLRPFDLETGPLVRFRVGLGPDGGLLLVAAHHIQSDFQSMALIISELAIAYQDGCLGGEPEYGFQLSREHESEQSIDWWRSYLAPVLGVELENRARATPRGFEYCSAIPAGLAAKIRSTARTRQVTPYSLCFCAYALLHAQENGGRRAVIGTTVDRRQAIGATNVAGYFINPVPVCFEFAGSWMQFLERQNRSLLDAIAHSDIPFACLVERLGPKRGAGNAFFDSMFTWLKMPGAPRGGIFEGPFLAPGHHPAGVTHDLVLMVREETDRFGCVWAYDANITPPQKVEELARRYQALLERIVESPDFAVEDLIETEERVEILL